MRKCIAKCLHGFNNRYIHARCLGEVRKLAFKKITYFCFWGACVLSRVWLLATLRTVARQAPLSWDSPGKNTRVGCHFLLQGIFPTQELNLCLLNLPTLAGRSFTTSTRVCTKSYTSTFSASVFVLPLLYSKVLLYRWKSHCVPQFSDLAIWCSSSLYFLYWCHSVRVISS